MEHLFKDIHKYISMGQTSVSRDEKVEPVQYPYDLGIPSNLKAFHQISDIVFMWHSSAQSL